MEIKEQSWGTVGSLQLSTRGACFMCMVNGMGGLEGNEETFSLQYLCNHLGIRVGEMFSVLKKSVPSAELLERVRVTLCGKCGKAVVKFSKLFQLLEVIQEEMGYWLGVIKKSILEAERDVTREFERGSDGMNVVEDLRKAVMEKCTEKTSKSKPALNGMCEDEGLKHITSLITSFSKEGVTEELFSSQSTEVISPEAGEDETDALDSITIVSTTSTRAPKHRESVAAKQEREKAATVNSLHDLILKELLCFEKPFGDEKDGERQPEEKPLTEPMETETVEMKQEVPIVPGQDKDSNFDKLEKETKEKTKRVVKVQVKEEVTETALNPAELVQVVAAPSSPPQPKSSTSGTKPVKKKNNLSKNCTIIQRTGKVKCNLCEKQFARKPVFYKHFRTTHLNILVKCHLCEKEFMDNTAFYQHFNTIHLAPQNFEGNSSEREEDYDFSMDDSMDEDSMEHDSLTPVSGSERSSSPDLKLLRRALRCNRGNCTYSTKRAYNLSRHQLSCNGQERSPRPGSKFTCTACGKLYPSITDLRVHMDGVHLQIRNFSCDQCDKKFKMRSHLKKHQQTVHSGVRYKCDNPGCSKTYSWSHHLIVHKAVNCPHKQ